MEAVLRLTVIAALCISAAALAAVVLKNFSFGKKPLFAAPKANPKKGIFYAFGQGMMPWEKESAKKHIITYILGFIYHFGIFAAFFHLILRIFSIQLGVLVIILLKILILIGLSSGLGLFIKRSSLKYMRKISCPDDFLANFLVDVFLVFSIVDLYFGNFRSLFYLSAIILLLYIPVGKIRHCFFFFYSRILFGRFFGRRGVYPRAQHQYKG